MIIPPELTELAQTLYEGARERPVGERTAYLEAACPGDPELRECILAMIDADFCDPDFLETPALLQILTSPLLLKGDLVEGRFEILEPAGAGGMAEVYEARDTETGEHIALKVVRRHLAGIQEIVGRLRTEIALNHKIVHPNVCKIHDLGIDRRPDGDLLFLRMNFLKGQTLHDYLLENGPLPGAVRKSIAEQVAAGLHAAHEAGVVHQDLKSSNVMLVPSPDGTIRAVITDFGIAAACEASEPGPGPLGTLDYLAPERMFCGESKPASDIFSFGVILCEMATGHLPFPHGVLPQERAKLTRVPIRKAGLRWQRVIVRCLDPDPSKRYSSALEVAQALRPARWPIAAAASVVIATGTYLAWPSMTPAVAIMPFGAPDAQTQGLIDYAAEKLQRNPNIRRQWLVYSPGEVRQTGVATGAQARSILGATHTLSGTVTRDGDSIRIAGLLGSTNRWQRTRRFEQTCRMGDTICLQDSVTYAMAGLLAPTHLPALLTPRISNEALPYYLAGLEYTRRDSVSYRQAIPLLEQAIAKDPSAPEPRVALAEAYMLEYRETRDAKVRTRARETTEQVLTQNPELPEAHAALAPILRAEGRFADSEGHLLRALQADPTNYLYHRSLAITYGNLGREKDAAGEYEKVIQLQPRYWGGYLDYAVFEHNRARYREAAELLERFIQMAPDHAQSLATLGGVYVNLARYPDAERVSRRACAVRPGALCYTNLGVALQKEHRWEEALQADHQALEFGTPDIMLLLNTAELHVHLGQQEEAREFYNRLVARARDELTANPHRDGRRAIMGYALARLGDTAYAVFEAGQALQSAPGNRDVRKYAILTYEVAGQRDKALEAVRGITRDLLQEIDAAPATQQLVSDPQYQEIAREIRSK
jgi:tetratricopeptide (TPR) repeat protein